MNLKAIFPPAFFDSLHVLLNVQANAAYDERVVSKEDILKAALD